MLVYISGSPEIAEMLLVEMADRVKRIALQIGVDAGRIGEIQDGVAAGAEDVALIDAGQESRAPVGVAAAGAFSAGGKDDERGELAVFAAQAVGDP